MSLKFSLKSGLLTVTLSVATAMAVLTPALEVQAGDGPAVIDCETLNKDGLAANVKTFCTSVDGKAGKIRSRMNKAQKAYNTANGKDIKCQACHENKNGGTLVAGWKEHWNGPEGFSKKFDSAEK